ncbi:MAG: N-acetylmuramic acid 6-phosphate etherase [Planctomycetota bacterium]
MSSRFGRLATEQRNPRTRHLDALSVRDVLAAMDAEEPRVLKAVAGQRAKIAAGVRLLEQTIRGGGRVFFAGAGTSGRLGVLEAAECPPTFDTPPSLLQAVMAGGPKCVWRSREGAEDDAADGARRIRRRARKGDAVVGIAASGVTPFVHGALGAARKRGAATILVTCNRKGLPRRAADVVIAPVVGPEVVTGSTRLKAGTATKLVLNRLTVATMVRLGKVHGNLMVDLQPKSAKLRDRACRIVRELAGVSRARAEKALKASGNRAKVAVVMLKKNVARREAERLLEKSRGRLRGALR